MKKTIITLLGVFCIYTLCFAGWYDSWSPSPSNPIGDVTIEDELTVNGGVTIDDELTVTGSFEVADGSGVIVGSGGAKNYIDGSGDLYVKDEMEVDGISYLNNLFIPTRAKIGFDGSTGNAYIMSDTGDMMKFYTNDTKRFEIGTSSIAIDSPLYTSDVVTFNYSCVQAAQSFTLHDNIETQYGDAANFSIGYNSKKNGLCFVSGNNCQANSKVEIYASSVTVNVPFVPSVVSTTTAPTILWGVGRAQNKSGRWCLYMATATVDAKSWMIMGTQTDN